MNDTSAIREHMAVIGADGVHVGTVDHLDGKRIKLTKVATGSHAGHHHYISTGLIAGVEGDTVRLSTSAANALNFEEEGGEDYSVNGQSRRDEQETENTASYGEENVG
jgi:hypothetical protein